MGRHVRPSGAPPSISRPRITAGAIIALAGVTLLFVTSQPANAIGTAVNLGTVGAYTVLGGEAVTNTGPSTLPGNVGVSPGSAVTGFPPGLAGGETHLGDAEALQAQADLVVAYDDAAGQPSDADIGGDLGNETLLPGVYTASSASLLTGPLTLDGQGDPDAVFIFQIGSMLTTASGSSVVLIGDAQACNVFWQVGSSATLGSATSFVGTIMALTSITLDTGATVQGRALARNGQVSLDSNVFTSAECDTTVPPTDTPTTPPTDTPTTPPTDTPTTPPTDTPTTPPGDTPPTPPGDTPSTPPGGTDDTTPPGGSGTTPSGSTPGAGSSGQNVGSNSDLADTGWTPNASLSVAAIVAILAGTALFGRGMRRAARTKG